jgi:hypothetical protein
LARTAASEKIISAWPAFFAFTTIDTAVPVEPLNPGVGTPPLKLIVPETFEYAGSSTHREKMEFALLIDTTSNRSDGKMILASELFIATPSEFNTIDSVAILPGESVTELEFICNVAACALLATKKDAHRKNSAV